MTTSPPVPDAARRRPGGAVLDAVLERITYANEETGYTIARVATDRSGADLLTVVGALLGAQPGESLRLVGRWGSHPQYGRQFEVDSYTTVLPATVQGIERYLGSGLIKGIGPRIAGPDRRALRRGHAAGDRGGAGAAGRGARAGPEAHRDDRAGVGGAEGHQGGDGLPAGRRGVDVAGGADLQEVRRRVDRGGAQRAVPAGRRRVGHRVQDRRHDRPGGRDPARQPAAGAGRHPVHPVRGRRQRALLPARAEPARRRRADPAGAPPIWSAPAWPSSPRPRASSGSRCPTRAPTAGRSRRCIWCRSTAPRPRWPPVCCGCGHAGADRLPAFAVGGLGQGAGLAAGSDRRRVGRRSRSRRCGWR